MKNNISRNQQGMSLVLLLIVMASISTLIFWQMQDAANQNYYKRISTFHVQSEKYMQALKHYKKVYCNAGGAYTQTDLYPSFVGVQWEDHFGSSSVFSIESGSGITQYIVSTTFPTVEVANIISARRIKNILVEHTPGSPVVKFTKSEELKANQFRNNFNRSRILANVPSTC